MLPLPSAHMLTGSGGCTVECLRARSRCVLPALDLARLNPGGCWWLWLPQMGFAIKDKVIPRAVEWFTGEIAPYDDDMYNDEYEEDGEY